MNEEDDGLNGAFIDKLEAGSPGSSSNLQRGDRILSINGRSMEKFESSDLANIKDGDVIIKAERKTAQEVIFIQYWKVCAFFITFVFVSAAEYIGKNCKISRKGNG